MPLLSIPTDTSYLTKGENRVLNRLKRVYEDIDYESYIYLTPRIRNLEPDFIIIDPNRGVLILEVKDWDINYLKSIDKKEVVISSGKTLYNPAFRTNQYFNLVKGLFESDLNLVNDNATLSFPLYSKVIFTNLRSDDNSSLKEMFNIYPTTSIFSEEISKSEIDTFFSLKKSHLNQFQIKTIRTLIFPEIKITAQNIRIKNRDETSNNIIKALDVEQERFAKRIPLGHYLLSGVPGSGKTVVLVTRAIHLIRQNPEWRVLIVTYNRSLMNKLNNRIKYILGELSFHENRLPNIEVKTFHQLALKLAGIKVPSNTDSEFWQEVLPQKALENTKPLYDAILIDEYQDFYNDWIKVCINSLKLYKLDDNRDVVNLFMAGDRLQSIYNPKEINWKQDIGLDMRGRAQLFKSSYRAGRDHLSLAIKYLSTDESLRGEVEKFYEGSNDIEYKNSDFNGELNFIEGQFPKVVEEIIDLLNSGYRADEILILANNGMESSRIFSMLPRDIQKSFKTSKDLIENYGTITTYYSSKGLESRVVILLNIDSIKSKKLLYVGMTRASEKLFLHSSSFSKGVGKELKELTLSDL